MSDLPESLKHLSLDDKKTLLTQLLQEKSQRRRTVFPLSHGQRGLWYLHQADPTNAVCNLSLPFRFRSPLNFAAFRQAIQDLVDRHPCLRTTFTEHGGELFQQVHEETPLILEMVDATALSEDIVLSRLEDEAHVPFDLESGPLFRMHVYSRADDDHYLLANVHHIIGDHWSLAIFMKEVISGYLAHLKGKPFNLAPLPKDYRDFVHSQAEMLAGPEAERLWCVWRENLAGTAHLLDLPTDRSRPSTFSHNGASIPFRVSDNTNQRLRALALAEQATPFATLLAVFQVLLHRYTNQCDFLVGAPFSGRSDAAYEGVIGYFINMSPLRANLVDNPTFREHLKRVTETVWHALQHQDLPFSLLVERLNVQRDPSRPPLIQVGFTHLGSPLKKKVEEEQLLLDTYQIGRRTCQSELEMVVQDWNGGLQGFLIYSADLWNQHSMEKMAERFQILLENATSNPNLRVSELNWFAASERQQILFKWNQTDSDFPKDMCLHHFFERQVTLTPDAIAVNSKDLALSYAELESSSNRLAHQLAEYEIHSGKPVALLLERSAEMITTLLAVLKAGGAYVPLDPATPPERLRSILTEIDAPVLLAQDDSFNMFSDHVGQVLLLDDLLSTQDEYSDSPLASDVQPDDLAYIIYTSGSTGTPKGVMVDHRAICNTISWRQRDVALDQDDRLLFLVPYYFDASVCLIFSALAGGAQLVIAEAGDERDSGKLLEIMEGEKITILPAPPSLLGILFANPFFEQASRRIRAVFTGAEAMAPGLPKQLFRIRDVPLYNFYGPTEVAVEATCYTLRHNEQRSTIPIGRPISNVKVYVLDGHQKLLPPGISGELYIGGAGIARGYLGSPELTAERFVADPFSDQRGARMYKTGDRCCWSEDGNIEFLGRLDHQVKVRGYRIELSEVEVALTSHPGVREAAAVVYTNHGGEPQLVVYVVEESESDPMGIDELQPYLKEKLPQYMIPTHIEKLSSLPRTATGKLDRQSLPAPSLNRAHSRREYVAPRNPLEQFLVDVWQNTLHIERVSVEDNFFEIGGSSIQSALVVMRIQEKLGQRLHVVSIFNTPNITGLAHNLAAKYPVTVARLFGYQSLPGNLRAGAASDTDIAQHQLNGETQGEIEPADLLIPLQPDGSQPPLFMVHPPGGIVLCYRPLAFHLGEDQPFYGIRSRGLYGESSLPSRLEDMAKDYLEAMRQVQPEGPYYLGGWSLGGVVALEMAQQLQAQGQTIGLLVFLDTTIPFGDANDAYAQEVDRHGIEYGLDISMDELMDLSPEEQLPYLWKHAANLGVIDEKMPIALVEQVLDDLKALFHHHVRLAINYTVQPYAGQITMFRPSDAPVQAVTTPDRGWSQLARGVDVHYVPGFHHSMVKEPHVASLAQKLKLCLQQSGQ